MLFIILIFKNCLSQGNNRLDSNRFVWRFGDYIFITSMTPSRAFVLVIREYIGWIHVKFILVHLTPMVSILSLYPILIFRIFHPILMEVAIEGWQTLSVLAEFSHSMAITILKKSKEIMKNTTAASKYIPRRPRISINWNPPFQTQIYLVNSKKWKISKLVIFRLTKIRFRE